MEINNCPKCGSGTITMLRYHNGNNNRTLIKIECHDCYYQICGLDKSKLINEWNKKKEDNGKEAYIKVLEDFIQKLRSDEVTDFEIESSNPPQMMFSHEYRDFIRVPSDNHSIYIRYTLKKKEPKKMYKCPECENNLDDKKKECCKLWKEMIECMEEIKKKTNEKEKYKCPVCNTSLNESMFCVKCCAKWTIKPAIEELKKDDFIAWGNYETIEEAEIEWSDIDDITDLPIDDQATYYDAGGISTMDVIKAKLTEDQYKGFLLGNIIKYSCRLNHKDNPTRDAEKVANYSKILSEL